MHTSNNMINLNNSNYDNIMNYLVDRTAEGDINAPFVFERIYGSCYTVLCCNMLYYTIPYYTIYYTMLFYAILYYTLLCFTRLHYTTLLLYYTIL